MPLSSWESSNSTLSFSKSFGIGNVGIKNMPPKIMAEQLLKKFNIFTVAIDYANVKGCRITPNIYNTIDEIDIFIDAVRKLASWSLYLIHVASL